MLKTMRRNVKSLKPVLWIVVATFVVAIFAIWGGAGRLGEANRAGTLVRVGGETITADEYYQALRARLQAMEKQFGDLNANLIQQLGLPQQTLEQLIQQRLLLQLAAEMGLRASDREVRAKIVSYPVFQRDGAFVGFEEYKRILDYNRIPLGEFEEGLRRDVVIGKVVRALTAGMFVSDEDVWTSYRKQNETAKIEYLVADVSRIEPPAPPSEAELRAHFEKSASAYRIPEKRTGDYVALRTEDLKKEVSVKDAEIEKYYRDNTAQFQEPEKVRVGRIWLPFEAGDKDKVLAQAREVRAKAAAGEDFAALARSHSKDDKASAGGDWGLYDWRSLAAAETEAVEKLDKDGVSEVIELEGGASILKVTEKEPAVTKPLAEARATIKGLLEDQKARALAGERIGRLEKLARKEKSLDVAAQKLGLKALPTGPLKKGDPLSDFDTSGAVSEALFGLKEKEISSPVYTLAGEALVELRSVEPERPAAFEEVRAEVEKDVLEARKKDRALEKLRALRTSLKDDWSAEAGRHGLEYKFVESHKREQYLSLVGERPEVDEFAFGATLKQVSEPVAVESGYALFRVLERQEVKREDFEKAKDAERESLLDQKRNAFLQSVLAKAREERKVRINTETFFRVSSDILSRFSRTS